MTTHFSEPHTSAKAPPAPAGGRRILCGRNASAILGLTLRDPEQSLRDQAEAMLRLGSAKPKARGREEL